MYKKFNMSTTIIINVCYFLKVIRSKNRLPAKQWKGIRSVYVHYSIILYLLSAYVFHNQSKTSHCIVWMFIIECSTTKILTLVTWIHSIFLIWNAIDEIKRKKKMSYLQSMVRSFFKHLLLRHVFYVFIHVHNTQKEIAFSLLFSLHLLTFLL